VVSHAKELAQYSSVYVYCLAGGRVVASYNMLAPLGVKNLICVDDGGFPDWEDAGYPVEK
jgi:rhodanese-related sulfurtransferase